MLKVDEKPSQQKSNLLFHAGVLSSRDTIIQPSRLFDGTKSSIVRIRHKVCSSVLDCLLDHMARASTTTTFNSRGIQYYGRSQMSGSCRTHWLKSYPHPKCRWEKIFQQEAQCHPPCHPQKASRENLQLFDVRMCCPGHMNHANAFHKSSLCNRNF